MKGHVITAAVTIALTLAALAIANRVEPVKKLVYG